MSLVSCNSSSDCLSELNNGKTLQKFCYGEVYGRNIRNFCDCANQPGYFGEECDIPSFQTVWLGITCFLTLLLSLCGMCFAGRVLVLYKNNFLDKANRSLDVILFSALLLAILGHACHAIRMIFFVVWVLNPQQTEIVYEKIFLEETEFATGPGGSIPSQFSNIGYILFGLSTVCVLFTWLLVLQKALNIIDPEISRRIQVFQVRVLVVTLTNSLVACFFLFGRYSIAGRIFLATGAVAIILISVYTRYWFLSCLKNFLETAEKESRIQLVNSYSKFHIQVLLVLLIFTTASTFTTLIYTKDILPGNFKLNDFFFDLNFILIGILLIATTEFVRRLLKRQESFITSRNNLSLL